MENLFLHILNMSITAGWITLGVIVLRLLLRKAPRWITVALWGLVGLRLILPFSMESVLSLIPDFSPITAEIITLGENPVPDNYHTLITDDNSDYHSSLSDNSEYIPEFNYDTNESSSLAGSSPSNNGGVAASDGNKSVSILSVASCVWLVGAGGMLIYSTVSYINIRRKTDISLPQGNRIYICDNIDTPFILGFIKPRIYLPSGISDEDAEYVIAHEKAHLKRFDHLIKPLGFLLLTVYWFNPLLWVAYVLLCRDIELACDEKVIRDMGIEYRKDYSTALLNCSIPRRMIAACPLAFGEVGVKQRIKTVLSYKKPAFWISVVAVALCIALSVGFLTNPVPKDKFRITVSDSGTDIEGITLRYKSSDFAENNSAMPYIELKWSNNTDTPYRIRERFTFFKKVDGEWTDTRIGYHNYAQTTHRLAEGEEFTKQYNLWHYNIDESGTYRFETYFYQSYGDSTYTERTAWIEFEIENPPKTDKSVFTKSIPSTINYRDKVSATIEYLHQSLDDNKVFLDDSSVITIGFLNKSGMTLTTHTDSFALYNRDTDTYIKTQHHDSDSPVLQLPADEITTITYSLSGLGYLTPGNYRFDAKLLSASKTQNVSILFSTNDSISKPTSTSQTCVAYHCNSSTEPVKPELLLYPYTRGFRMVLSGYDDTERIGSYSVKGDRLILKNFSSTDSAYTFHITDTKQLEFIEDESAKLPSYWYSAEFILSKPFADGAVFEADLKKAPDDFLSEEVAPVSFAEVTRYKDTDFTHSQAKVTISSPSGSSSILYLSNKYNRGAEKLYNLLKDSVLTVPAEPAVYTKAEYYVNATEMGISLSVFSDDMVSIGDSSPPYLVSYYCEGITEKLRGFYEEMYTEQSRNFSVTYRDSMYHCIIRANDGTVLCDESLRREPHIELIDKNLIFCWNQSGTGTLTRSGKYYNLETKEISEPFIGIADYCNGLVSNTMSGKVKITSLYNPGKVQIIENFSQPAANITENIVGAKFTDNGKKITITYMTGESSYTSVTETFDITI